MRNIIVLFILTLTLNVPVWSQKNKSREDSSRNLQDNTFQQQDSSIYVPEKKLIERDVTSRENAEYGIGRATKSDVIQTATENGTSENNNAPYRVGTGPNNRPVYIDRDGRYFYINSRRKKVYVTESEFKRGD